MKNCIFCSIAKGEAKSWKVYENWKVCAFLDINPANKYHTIVISKKHYTNIFDIPPTELKEIISVVKKLAKIYEKKLGIKNIQIINSSGAEAQQDVFHINFHIVPRQKGDGQDIRWEPHPEWTKEYDRMLKRLKQ